MIWKCERLMRYSEVGLVGEIDDELDKVSEIDYYELDEVFEVG